MLELLMAVFFPPLCFVLGNVMGYKFGKSYWYEEGLEKGYSRGKNDGEGIEAVRWIEAADNDEIVRCSVSSYRVFEVAGEDEE